MIWSRNCLMTGSSLGALTSGPFVVGSGSGEAAGAQLCGGPASSSSSSIVVIVIVFVVVLVSSSSSSSSAKATSSGVPSAWRKSSGETLSRKSRKLSTISSVSSTSRSNSMAFSSTSVGGGEDGRVGAHGQGERVAGPRVDVDLGAVLVQRERGVEGALLELGDGDARHVGVEAGR